MQPLRVTAELAEHRLSAINLDLPLDGPLAWAWVREKDPEDVYLNEYGTPDWVKVDLSDTLQVVKTHKEWFYACSWAIFKPLRKRINYRHRRFDLSYAERYADIGKKGKIITAGGTFKTRRIPLVVMTTEQIVWFCVGSQKRIEELLAAVEYIGSARAAGYGRVKEWRVEPWPEDWSVYGPDGCLMRAVPSEDGDMISSIRPPYWAPPKMRCRTPDFEQFPWNGVLL